MMPRGDLAEAVSLPTPKQAAFATAWRMSAGTADALVAQLNGASVAL